MKLNYTVYQYEITTHMQGDREEEYGWSRDPFELYPVYSTVTEARAKVEELAASEKITLNPSRIDIGSITRNVYIIEEWAQDESGNPIEDYEPAQSISIDPLDFHPEIKQLWQKAKSSYYRYLDYEEDYYCTVTDELELSEFFAKKRGHNPLISRT